MMGRGTCRHHIGTSGFEGRALILRSVGHDDHIVVLRGVSAIPDQVLANIHSIVNAAVQVMFAPEVVDADQESFSARHLALF